MRTWFSRVLLAHGGILLHAAGVVLESQAMLFCGPSGSGKTTLARMAGSREILSDESVAILRLGGNTNGNPLFVACGTPFFGELAQSASNRIVPLREIFLIDPRWRSAKGFRIHALDAGVAAASILAQTISRAPSRQTLEILLSFVEELVSTVSVRGLTLKPGSEVWRFLDDCS